MSYYSDMVPGFVFLLVIGPGQHCTTTDFLVLGSSTNMGYCWLLTEKWASSLPNSAYRPPGVYPSQHLPHHLIGEESSILGGRVCLVPIFSPATGDYYLPIVVFRWWCPISD
ncbi:hypothetical protein IGI04_015238 [Brassica rapa subsp. trilocularis]|uniref:Uncharacterized protein n=1 Tax=Brassica rapa subsp. trilocularis TaxID=1813537 RepID=A0ABQ7MS07_BRACM|nr:hypothetical protein IGI04_015238 [Brassica rapa subsp. trilocularis]